MSHLSILKYVWDNEVVPRPGRELSSCRYTMGKYWQRKRKIPKVDRIFADCGGVRFERDLVSAVASLTFSASGAVGAVVACERRGDSWSLLSVWFISCFVSGAVYCSLHGEETLGIIYLHNVGEGWGPYKIYCPCISPISPNLADISNYVSGGKGKTKLDWHWVMDRRTEAAPRPRQCARPLCLAAHGRLHPVSGQRLAGHEDLQSILQHRPLSARQETSRVWRSMATDYLNGLN